MLKRQKIGILIFVVLIGIVVPPFFSDSFIKSNYTDLDALLMPSILFGLIYSAYKFLKKEKREIRLEHTYKGLFYFFCEYFLIGAAVPLILISFLYTYEYISLKLECLFNQTNPCEIYVSGYYFFYSTLFFIVTYGYHKKMLNDKSNLEEQWEKRIDWKEKRIQELGQKLKKLKYTNEEIVDWKFLDKENDL